MACQMRLFIAFISLVITLADTKHHLPSQLNEDEARRLLGLGGHDSGGEIPQEPNNNQQFQTQSQSQQQSQSQDSQSHFHVHPGATFQPFAHDNFFGTPNWDNQRPGDGQDNLDQETSSEDEDESDEIQEEHRNCQNFEKNRVIRNGNSWYFFTWEDQAERHRQSNWNSAREFCKRHCMDLAAVESLKEHQFLSRRIRDGDVYGAFTSGRFCNANNCSFNSYDLQHQWAWTSTGKEIKQKRLWSKNGGLELPQPDNLSGRLYNKDELCLALLNDWYYDGVAWHDFVCTDLLPFICEAKARPRPEQSSQSEAASGGGQSSKEEKPKRPKRPYYTPPQNRPYRGPFKDKRPTPPGGRYQKKY